jgi:type IV pilus assembly protein PilW
VQLAARTGDVFPNGQILQVVCPGTLKYAYFTVSTTTTATANVALIVPLAGADTSNPFRRQDVAGGMVNCRVFQIDRYRFHIRPVLQGGGRYVPYLVLDRGIDVTGGAGGAPDGLVDVNDEVLIAEGIEAFQVAYEFPNPDLGRAGATASTSLTFSTAVGDQTMSEAAGPSKIAMTAFPGTLISGQTDYAPSSFFRYSFSDPMRQTFHQANIRAVEIALVARSPDPAPTAPTNLQVDSTFRLFNQSGAPTWITSAPKLASGTDGYQRVQVDATVDLPNMTVRSIPGF